MTQKALPRRGRGALAYGQEGKAGKGAAAGGGPGGAGSFRSAGGLPVRATGAADFRPSGRSGPHVRRLLTVVT